MEQSQLGGRRALVVAGAVTRTAGGVKARGEPHLGSRAPDPRQGSSHTALHFLAGGGEGDDVPWDSPFAPSTDQAPPEQFAVVEIGGHQMIVEKGRWYDANRLQVSSAEGRGMGAGVPAAGLLTGRSRMEDGPVGPVANDLFPFLSRTLRRPALVQAFGWGGCWHSRTATRHGLGRRTWTTSQSSPRSWRSGSATR